MSRQTLDKAETQETHEAAHAGIKYADVQQGPPEKAVTNDNATKGMIFPDSANRYLNEKDVTGLDEKGVRVARNEIYARHGRPFATPEMAAHFESQPWYQKNLGYKDSDLNDIEKRNVAYLNLEEWDHKYKAATVAGDYKGSPYTGDTSGSVLPDSSKRNLTDADIDNLSEEQLALGRNEIYARRGRTFSDPDLAKHFEGMPWYQKNAQYKDSDLSPQDYRNVLFIKIREMELDYDRKN
jgi:hypothetical protein